MFGDDRGIQRKSIANVPFWDDRSQRDTAWPQTAVIFAIVTGHLAMRPRQSTPKPSVVGQRRALAWRSPICRRQAALVGVTGGQMLAASLLGCAPESQGLESLLVVPGYYDTLDCRELNDRVQNLRGRVTQLAQLRERSSGGAGGTVANLLAYDTDYAKASASLRNATEAATRKGCDLTPQTQAKPAAAPGPKPSATPKVGRQTPAQVQ
jgi:hypothetical protein